MDLVQRFSQWLTPESPPSDEKKWGTMRVVTGPMFSGKSAHAALLANRQVHCRKRAVFVVPRMSVRIDGETTRDGISPQCPLELIERDALWSEHTKWIEQGVDLVVLDEAQFFGENLIKTARALRRAGVHIVVAGLMLDANRKPFGELFELLKYADDVLHLHAACHDCTLPRATLSYNLAQSVPTDNPVLVGDNDTGYVALCQTCYEQRSL